MKIIIKQTKDGFLKVTVKIIGTTWAKNLKDVPKAIQELIESYNINKSKYGN